MPEEKAERLLRGMKGLLDDAFDWRYRAHGPLEVTLGQFPDSKGGNRRNVYVRTPEGDWVEVSASPSGKVLHVVRSSDKVLVDK